MALKGIDKLKSTKSMDMTKGGGSGDGTGPTSSPRSYPKGGGAKATTEFLPNKGKRSATTWVVGGV